MIYYNSHNEIVYSNGKEQFRPTCRNLDECHKYVLR